MPRTPEFQFPVSWEPILDELRGFVPEDNLQRMQTMLLERDRALEDFLSFRVEIIIFDHKDAVTVSTSDPYAVRRGGRVKSITIGATTTSAASSTFQLKVNGTQIGTDLVLPATDGATPYEVDITPFRYVYVDRGVHMTANATVVGASLAGLVVTVELEG